MRIVSVTLRIALAAFPLASLLAVGQPKPDAGKERKQEGLGALLETGKLGDKDSGVGELRFDSDTLELDFNRRTGTFEGNVKVTDGRMLLLADKMTVYMTEDNELKLIEATGNVVISEIGQQRKATAGTGVFDVAKDEIVLSDHPTLSDAGWEIKESEKIVYSRKKGTFKVYKLRGGASVDDGGNDPRDLFAPGAGSDKKDKEEPKP